MKKKKKVLVRDRCHWSAKSQRGASHREATYATPRQDFILKELLIDMKCMKAKRWKLAAKKLRKRNGRKILLLQYTGAVMQQARRDEVRWASRRRALPRARHRPLYHTSSAPPLRPTRASAPSSTMILLDARIRWGYSFTQLSLQINLTLLRQAPPSPHHLSPIRATIWNVAFAEGIVYLRKMFAIDLSLSRANSESIFYAKSPVLDVPLMLALRPPESTMEFLIWLTVVVL